MFQDYCSNGVSYILHLTNVQKVYMYTPVSTSYYKGYVSFLFLNKGLIAQSNTACY